MRLPRWLKYTLAGFAALFAAVTVAIVVIVNTIDVDRYAQLAIAAVKTTTGRELAIRGKLDITLFPRLAVRAEDVSFANAAGGSRPEMIKAKRVDGAVALLPLLRRKVEITRLAVTDLDVLLEKDAKGVGNWVLKPPAPGTGSQPAGKPDFEFDVPELVVDRGNLAWRNGASKETLRLAVRRLRLKERALSTDRDVELDASFRDQPFTVKGRIGRIVDLIAKAADWPVDVVATTDGASATAKGAIDWSAALPALDLALKAELKHSAGVAKLAGTPLDLPMPATLTAKFTSGRGEQVADPLKLTLGKSTVEGRASLKTNGARPFLSAKLSSPEIDLAQANGAKREPRSGRVFSDAPFPLEALRRFDADAELAVGRLVLRNKLPLEALKARAVLKAGRLELQPVTATVGGGAVSGRLVLDASRPKAPTLALALDGKGISMERIAAATGQRRERHGWRDGHRDPSRRPGRVGGPVRRWGERRGARRDGTGAGVGRCARRRRRRDLEHPRQGEPVPAHRSLHGPPLRGRAPPGARRHRQLAPDHRLRDREGEHGDGGNDQPAHRRARSRDPAEREGRDRHRGRRALRARAGDRHAVGPVGRHRYAGLGARRAFGRRRDPHRRALVARRGGVLEGHRRPASVPDGACRRHGREDPGVGPGAEEGGRGPPRLGAAALQVTPRSTAARGAAAGVIPANVGIQHSLAWTPASAGVTSLRLPPGVTKAH